MPATSCFLRIMAHSFPGVSPRAAAHGATFLAFVRSMERTERYTPHKGRRTRAASHRREPPIPPPPHTLIRPLDGESPGLEAAPTEQNALRATRRLIARIKCEACGGVESATAWRVLSANDAQIIEEDTEAQRLGDLALFRGWHRGRGTDPEAALEELRRRTESHVRELAEENGRSRGAEHDR